MHADKPSPKEVADLLVRCRSERNLSLSDVARATKLNEMTLSRFERMTAAPRRTTLLRLTEFLRKYGYFPKTEAA